MERSLTPRETEVLALAAKGLTHKEIAERLGISARTARNHLANLYRKLDIHGRAETVHWAVRLGLLDLGMAGQSRDMYPLPPAQVPVVEGVRFNAIEHTPAGLDHLLHRRVEPGRLEFRQSVWRRVSPKGRE